MSEQEYEFVGYEQDGPVVTITFDRPDRMNAIGPQMHAELVNAWDRFRVDDSALVGVLTGAGDDAFCAGGDLKDAFAGNPPHPITPEDKAAHARGERPGVLGPSRWTDLYKPTIAAVNGVAYAGGLEWACWADIAIADERASFGVTCRRWNIGLADGGSQRLPRILGWRRALEMIITGRVVEADEALSIGLVNEVVPAGTSLQRAQALAHEIAALPQPALRGDKEALIKGANVALHEGLRIEAEVYNRLIDGSELAEGLRRFNERDHPDRKPDGPASTRGIHRPRSERIAVGD